MDIGAKEIIMVLLGFTLAWVPQWFDRRRRIVAHWAALHAEALLCVESARTYLNDNVMAPLYRLPTTAYEKAFPVLLVEGEMTRDQILTLTRFFSQAQDINRGLDYATAMNHRGEDEKTNLEYNRALLKAKVLIGDADGNEGLSKDAFELLDAKRKPSRLLR